MKTYIIKAFADECGENFYIVTVPDKVESGAVIEAFVMAQKYAVRNCSYFEHEGNIKEGIQNYDKHYEKMLEMAWEHPLDVFQFYISECCGWKIEEFDFDFILNW